MMGVHPRQLPDAVLDDQVLVLVVGGRGTEEPSAEELTLN